MPYYDFDSEEERKRREQEAIRDAYFQEWKRQNNSAKAPKIKAAKRKEMAAANIQPVMYGGNINPNNDQLPAMTTAEMAARQQARYMQQVAPAADAAAAMIQNAPVDQYMMKRFLPNISDKSLEQTFAEAAKIDPNAKPAEPVKPAIINPYTSALDQAALIRDQLIPKKEEPKTPRQSALQGVNVPDGGIQQPNYASKNPVIPQPSAQETYTPDEELQIADINVKTLPKKEQESLKSVAKKQQEAYQIPMFDASNIDNLDNYTVMLQKAEKEQEMVKERDEFQQRNNLTDQQMNNFLYYQQMLNDKEKNDKVRSDIRESLHTGSGARQAGNALALNALSVMNSPFRGATAAAGNLAQRALGRESRPAGFGIQTNGSPYDYQNFSQAVQEETGNRIAETRAGELGRTAYNIGTSIAESAYNIMLANGAMHALSPQAATGLAGTAKKEAVKKVQKLVSNISLLPFGLNAYQSTYEEARNRGVDEKHAQTAALFSGAAEVITEKLPMDDFWDMFKGNHRSARKLVTDALAHAGIEGLEEIGSDIINNTVDALLMGDQSELRQKAARYEAAGYSPVQAGWLVFKDTMKDMTMSGIGGTISGLIMGGIGAAGNVASTMSDANQMYNANTHYNEIADSIDTNRDNYQNQSAYQSAVKAQEIASDLDQKQRSGQRITNRDKFNLYTNTMDAVQTESATQQENARKQEEKAQLPKEDTTPDTTKEEAPTTKTTTPTTKQTAPSTEEVTANKKEPVTPEQNEEVEVPESNISEENNVTSDIPEQYRATYVNDTELAEQLQNAKNPQELVEAYQNAVDTRQGNEHELTMAKGYYDAYALKMAKAKTNNFTLEDIAKAAETTLSTQRAYEAGLNEQQIDKSVLSSAAQQAYNDGLQSALVARERNVSVQQDRMKQLANGYMTDISRRAFIERYIPGMNADIYKKSFDMAYDAGRQVDTYTIPGADAKQAIEKSWDDFAKKNSIIFSQLSVDQAKGIFSEGMTTAMRDRQAAIARSNMEKLTAVKGNGTFTDLRANPTNDASTRVIAGAARLFGLNIELRDSIEGGSNGYYDAKRGTIVLNASSNKTLVTLTHELGEFTDSFNTEEFQPLVQSGMQTLNEILGEKEYQKMRRAYEDAYVAEFLNEKRRKTDADLDKEIFCDNIFTILGSEEGMNNLISKIDQNCTVQQAKTIKEKLSEMIGKVIDAFKSIISSGKLNNWQQAAAEDSAKRMQDLQDRLTSAMANAVKNYETASLQEIESDIPVQKRFNLEAGVEQTKDLIAVHNLTSDQLLGDIALGGLPSPSIAIIRAGMGHEKYGDISLVFGKDTIDPKKSAKNKVYGGDAWTPTFPSVEYKLNDEKIYQVAHKIEELVPQNDARLLGGISVDNVNTPYRINSADGDPVAAYANSDVMKYAYLVDKGENIKPKTREKRLTSKFENNEIVAVADMFSEEELSDIRHNMREFLSDNQEKVEEIRKTINDEHRKKYEKFNQEDNPKLRRLYEKDFIDEMYFSLLDNIINAAEWYKEHGISQESDPTSLREIINQKTDEDGFHKWLGDLFNGIIEKKGIRNGKSLFTNSGNRRNWDQLHDDYTLENIVKAMSAEDDKGSNTFTAQSAIQALATKDFKSIADIRKSEGQLRIVSPEEYSALRDEYWNKFNEIAKRLINPNSHRFMEIDEVASNIADAITRYKNADSIEKYLKKYYGNRAYDGIGRDIVDLRDSIAEMPTGYFEAKPKRAVWLDEVQYAIIPDNSPAELTKALSDNNITYRTYTAGDEASRLEVMDSLEDVRFSREVNSDGKQLTKDQQEYFKDSKVRTPDGSLKVMYHGTPTGGFTVFKNGLQFFTDNKEYADRYQNPSASSRQSGKESTNPQTYAVYLNITKPFDIRDPKMRKTFINDYVKGGWALGINPYTEYKDSTVSGLPSWEEADNIYDWMEENDLLDQYDGILVDEGGIPGENGEVISRGIAYITFSPEQIKNIDNLSPTSNSDIRYSKDVGSEGQLNNNAVSEAVRRIYELEHDSAYKYEYGIIALDEDVEEGDELESGRAIQIAYRGMIQFDTTQKMQRAFQKARKAGKKNYALVVTEKADYLDDSDEIIMTDPKVIMVLNKETKKPVKVDTEGRYLSKGQQDFFKNSKLIDRDGALKVMYHGSKTGGFTVFNPDISYGGSLFFTDSMEHGKSYSDLEYDDNETYVPDRPMTFKKLSEIIEYYSDGYWSIRKEGNKYLINEGNDYNDTEFNSLMDAQNYVIHNFANTSRKGYDANYEVYLNIENPYVVDAGGRDWFEIPDNRPGKYGELWETDEIAQYAKENGYDGVIIYRVVDSGNSTVYREYFPHTVAVVFDSSKVKSVDNKNPSENPDIRYSREVSSEAPANIVSADSRHSLEVLSSDKDDVVTIPSLKGDPTIFFTGTDEEIAAYEAQENAAKDQWKAIIDAPDFAAFQVDLSRGRTKILSPSIRGGLYQLSNLWNGEPVSHQLFGEKEGSEGENYWHPMKDLYSELVDLNRHHDVEVKVLKRKTADSLNDLRRSMDAPEVDFTEMITSKNDDEADSGIGNVLAEGSRILKGQQVDQQMVRKIARKLTRKYGSKADINQFADDISRVFAYAQSHDIASADSEELARIMTEVAMPVIKEAQGESNEELKKQIRKNVSGLKLDLSEQQHKEVVYKYHSYQNYKQAMRKHGIEISANGASMDGSWGEIVDKMMGTLTYAENEGNEPIMLLDALNSLDQKIVQNGFGMNNPEVAKDLAMDVIAAYYDEMGKQQTSRKGVKDKDIADLKKQVAEARKIADDYKKQIKKEYEERYDEALKDLKQAKQLASEETMLQVAALRAQNRHDIQRRLDAQEKAKQKSEIQKGSRQLLNMLANPTNAKHVPISLEAPVLDLLSSIDFVGPKIDKLSDGRYQTKVLVTTEEQGQLRRRFETYVGDTYQDVMRQYQEAMQSGAGSKAQRTWQQKLSTVKDLYSRAGTEGDSNSATDLLEMLDKSLLPDLQKILDDNDGLKTISSLSADELKTINKAIKNITTAINKIDKFYTSPESVSKLGNDIMEHAKKVMDTNVRSRARESLKDFFTLDNATPETYFHGLGKSGEKVFRMLTRANNVKARDIRIAQEYMADLLKDVSQKDIDSMTGDKAKIIYEEGTMKLDVGDVMYLYMLLKRQDAESHKYGGFEMDDKEIKGKIYRDTKPHFLDEAKLRDITDKLTPKQKEIAEKMQWFMANTCAEWGNETAILLYGYEKFTDPNYISMTVDKKTVRTNAQNSAEGMINSIRESGFTKNVVPNANNPLIIRNIFDVFSEHVTNMAAYHAYAAPLTDVIRWNNFKFTEEFEEGEYSYGRQHTVKEAIDDIYGKGGQSYLVQLVRDINQMEKQTKVGTARFGGALTSRYKAAATLANLRVVAQQPTAWFRAGEMIDAKYLAAGLAPNKAADKMQAETSDISWIKSQGNIDGYITHSMKQTITRASSTREKINDAAGWLASKADDVTWNKLYRAVYAEQLAKYNGDLSSEEVTREFAQKVNDRFDEVIARTQVVDGTLMRSQLMRSSDRKNVSVSAFMAEPTKSYNMFLRDYIDITQGKREGKKIRPADLKHLSRTAAVYLVTNVANAVMQSIFDAERDDDDDKSYIEKLLNAFGIDTDSEKTFKDKALTFLEGNFMDDLNMLNNIPIINDMYEMVWSAVKKTVWGENTYTSSSSDFDVAGLNELVKAWNYTFNKSGNSKITLYGTIAQDVKALSQVSGIPVYNLMRECVALYNTINDAWGGENIRRTAPTSAQLAKPVFDSIDTGSDYKAAIEKAVQKGSDYEKIETNITKQYKQQYIDLMREGKTDEAAKLENRLMMIYDYLNEKEGQKPSNKNRVKKFYTDWQKENGVEQIELTGGSESSGSRMVDMTNVESMDVPISDEPANIWGPAFTTRKPRGTSSWTSNSSDWEKTHHINAARMIQESFQHGYDAVHYQGGDFARNAQWHLEQINKPHYARKKTYGSGGGNAVAWKSPD